ncbi:MAG: YfiT family bacillithiol transferase [Gemmatimonadaceae bacterium]
MTSASESAAEDLRYPIGKFSYDGDSSRVAIDRSIASVESLPSALRAAVDGLSDEQMSTPYRGGGWTPREVVHHVADSHMNAYIRMKLALTEDAPTVKPYDEAAWVRLADTRVLPVAVSLDLLDSLHARWVALMRAMADSDFDRTYIHPDHQRSVPMREVAALYAWHGRHHTAHIESLRERNRWT